MRSEQDQPFERTLVERLKEFIREDCKFSTMIVQNNHNDHEQMENRQPNSESNGNHSYEMEIEVGVVEKAWLDGVVHLVGESEVVAGKGAGLGKRILIDYGYRFLRRNLRQTDKMFDIPHKRLLKVGMTYEL